MSSRLSRKSFNELSLRLSRVNVPEGLAVGELHGVAVRIGDDTEVSNDGTCIDGLDGKDSFCASEFPEPVDFVARADGISKVRHRGRFHRFRMPHSEQYDDELGFSSRFSQPDYVDAPVLAPVYLFQAGETPIELNRCLEVSRVDRDVGASGGHAASLAHRGQALRHPATAASVQ